MILLKGNAYWIIAVTAENSITFRISLLGHFRESVVWDKLIKLWILRTKVTSVGSHNKRH